MSKLMNFSIVFIALVVFVLVIQTLQSFVRPFVVAIILTLLLMPLLRYFESKKIPFMVTFAGVIVVAIIAVVILVALLSGSLSGNADASAQQEQIKKLAEDTNGYLSTISGNQLSLDQFLDPEKIGGYVAQIVGMLLNAARLVITEVFMVLLFMIFVIPSYKIMIRDVKKHFGDRKADQVRSVLFQIERSTRDYLVTKTAISLGTAIASALILILFKADYVFFFAALIFLLNFIPNIGSFIAVAVAVFSFFLTHGFVLSLIWLMLLLIVVQVIFGNILEPKIAGNKLKLSPIVILLGLFFWGWTWGIIGMFLAVPLMSIIKIILENIESTKTIAKFMS